MKDDYDSKRRSRAIPPPPPGSDDEGDEDTDMEQKHVVTKPVAVEAIIGQTEYKFLPDRLRQMILAELVYCTHPVTRIFPGCTANVDSTAGRQQAFWLALCRCVIINMSMLLHSDIVKAIPATDDMDTHVPLFKKRDIPSYKFDIELVKELANNLAFFDGGDHKLLVTALGIGGKTPFNVPVDMTLNSQREADKTAKALEMMTLPFRLPDVASALGINMVANEPEDDGDEGGIGGGDGDENEDMPRCVMEAGDTCDSNYIKGLKKCIKRIRKAHTDDGRQFRTIIVSSPPWGTLDGDRTGPGCEDEPLTAAQIKTMGIAFAEMFDADTVLCFHLPPLDLGFWRTQLESTGMWASFMSPVSVVSNNAKGLTVCNKYQLATNVFTFLCLHRADEHPPVTSEFLKDKPGMVKLSHSLWNAGTVISSALVPKVERLSIKVEKKATYVRTQQLATAVVRPLIRIFGRALHEQPQVCVVDPFMGTGSTAMAAHQLGCSFVGWDRDPVVVSLANKKFNSVIQVSAHDCKRF